MMISEYETIMDDGDVSVLYFREAGLYHISRNIATPNQSGMVSYMTMNEQQFAALRRGIVR